MFLDKLLKKIGQFFENLFNGAEKAWDKLDDKVQDAMIKASEIVDTINRNLDSTPETIILIIQTKFPGVPIEKIREVLHKVGDELNLLEGIPDDDLLTTIQRIKDYLGTKKGAGWAIASDTIAKLIAVALAPKETKATQIIALMWYVYQTIVKKQ
jgi:hypothetical protein